jgi:hypothetical protein
VSRGRRFRALLDAADLAGQRLGVHVETFELAGRVIRLESAGPGVLAAVAPAFAHLPRAGEGALVDLRIRLFDTASSGVSLPDLGLTQVVGSGSEDQVITPIISDGGQSFVLHGYEQAVSYLDHASGEAVLAVADAAAIPPWDRACPLRALLTWWFAPQGLLLAHGAAVGSEDGAVVLVGRGGSGKSTTSLACLADGLGFLGDDYVLIDSEATHVWSIYGSAKLAPEHLARYPDLLRPDEPLALDPPDAKSVGWPLRDRPEARVLSAPIRAFVVPGVVGGPICELVPQSASRALLALAPLTMFQTPGDQRLAFELASAVVRAVPSLELRLGDDMSTATAALAGILREES